jgi:type I restriction enzyme R subunit
VNAVIDEVCDRAINNLEPDMQDKFRKTCRQFYNLFTFLSQIIPFHDPDLGKLAPFCLAVSKKMPYKKESLPYDVLSESQLQSYKIQYIGTQELKLESGDTQMQGMKPGDSQPPAPRDFDWLSNIIKALNETFGIDLTDEDKVELSRLRERIDNDQELAAYFIPQNARDDVKAKFDETVDAELLDFITSKYELYNKLTEDRANTLFKNIWFNEMYDRKVRGLI